jgi:hypothetical protein
MFVLICTIDYYTDHQISTLEFGTKLLDRKIGRKLSLPESMYKSIPGYIKILVWLKFYLIDTIINIQDSLVKSKDLSNEKSFRPNYVAGILRSIYAWETNRLDPNVALMRV